MCGDRVEPWRALPVPFCLNGFLPPPLTSARVLVDCVPARRWASCAVTTWCITGTLGCTPNTSASSSTSLAPPDFELAFLPESVCTVTEGMTSLPLHGVAHD